MHVHLVVYIENMCSTPIAQWTILQTGTKAIKKYKNRNESSFWLALRVVVLGVMILVGLVIFLSTQLYLEPSCLNP